jgi:hypothetical protein
MLGFHSGRGVAIFHQLPGRTTTLYNEEVLNWRETCFK